MMYEHLSNYFDESARSILKEGVAAWHRLTQDEDWNGWLRVGKAIATAQDVAASVTKQNSGRGFNAFMASCYAKPTYLGEFATIAKSERSLAAKCWRNHEAIEKWRASIGQTQAMRMNHPAVVWKAYEAAQRPPPAQPVTVASPYARLQQEHAKALEENDRLKKASDGGSLFDLRNDSIEAIVRVLLDPSNVSESKARRIADGILAGLKKRKPAG